MVAKLKKILVSCGADSVVSSFIAEEIKGLLKDKHLNAEIIECKASDIGKLYKGADIIVSTKQLPSKISRPKISGIPFITGNEIEEEKKRLIELLEE
ncbi:MAG: hypothetical protein R6U35_06090 [Candidatus Humimicrobiaceae bacterium]